jgi:hypothetical protein
MALSSFSDKATNFGLFFLLGFLGLFVFRKVGGCYARAVAFSAVHQAAIFFIASSVAYSFGLTTALAFLPRAITEETWTLWHSSLRGLFYELCGKNKGQWNFRPTALFPARVDIQAVRGFTIFGQT